MGSARNFTCEQVTIAIKGTAGIVSNIAKKLACDWSTASRYIGKWDATKVAYANEKEAVLDLAESTLVKSIRDGDVQSAKWILSTKGKERGYTERQELTGADGKEPITIKIIGAGCLKE